MNAPGPADIQPTANETLQVKALRALARASSSGSTRRGKIEPVAGSRALLAIERRQSNTCMSMIAPRASGLSRVRFTCGQQRSNSATNGVSASLLVARSSAALSVNSYIA